MALPEIIAPSAPLAVEIAAIKPKNMTSVTTERLHRSFARAEVNSLKPGSASILSVPLILCCCIRSPPLSCSVWRVPPATAKLCLARPLGHSFPHRTIKRADGPRRMLPKCRSFYAIMRIMRGQRRMRIATILFSESGVPQRRNAPGVIESRAVYPGRSDVADEQLVVAETGRRALNRDRGPVQKHILSHLLALVSPGACPISACGLSRDRQWFEGPLCADCVEKLANRTTQKNLAQVDLQGISAAASLVSATARASDRFWTKCYGPSRRRA